MEQISKLKLENKLDKLIKKKKLDNKKIIIFGVSSASQVINEFLIENNYKITCFIDNDLKNLGQKFLGVDIYQPSTAVKMCGEDIIILIYSRFSNEMKMQLKKIGISNRNIYVLSEKQILTLKFKLDFLQNSLQILKGYKIYKDIERKYGGNKIIYMCPYPGTGDIYLIGLYINEYFRRNNVNDYIFAVVGKAAYKIAKLFKLKNIHIITEEEANYLAKAYMFLEHKNISLEILNDSFEKVYTNSTKYIRGYKNLNFFDMYRYCLFNFNDEEKIQLPEFNFDEDYVSNLFNKHNLKKGNTIILSPYANTISNIPEEFWIKLVDALLLKGYSICTNCGSSKEEAIKGTVPILFDFKDAVCILNYAGYFIGKRSGFCDIISSSRCKKIILYYKKFTFFNASLLEFFGLNRMGISENCIELEYDETDYNELLKKVLIDF